MKIYDIQICGYDRPIGYSLEKIVCSWKIAEGKGVRQTATEILVATDEEFINIVFIKRGILSSLAEELNIEQLPRMRYFVRVSVTDDAGDIGVGETYFETGKIGEPWQGRWIGLQKGDSYHPQFLKTFCTVKSVKRARLYLSGLGLFEAFINGKKVGEDVLAPFINDYETAVQYCTYDVTRMVAATNDLTILLGNGWYKGRLGYNGECADGSKTFLLIAELHLLYADETEETICTDDSWTYSPSIFECTDIYDGERQNYLRPPKPARQAEEKNDVPKLCERYSLPLGERERLPVKNVITTPKREKVLDFGQNFAGIVEFRGIVERGKTLKLEFAEILQKGCFYNENYRTAKSLFEYVSDGTYRTVKARFTFFGFRYVKVSGICSVRPENFTGIAVYSQMRRTGTLETSDEKINRLYQNTVWGMKSNFLDMPTDCPQRDERLAWTGDAQVFAPTACFHMDTKAFYQKFLRDLRYDQRRHNGAVALYLPRLADVTASVWGDAATFIPTTLYRRYGDKIVLKENYLLMKDWVDYIHAEDEKNGGNNLFDFGFHFGDWLALDGESEQSFTGSTDAYFIASCYYYQSAKNVAEAAEVLGYAKDKTFYTELMDNIFQAVLNKYFTDNGALKIDTQTAYLVALRFGIYKRKKLIVQALRSRFDKDRYKIKGGFVGAPTMLLILAENGMTDLAYDFLFQKRYPSWLYEVNLGATTVWERWNSVLPDGTINRAGMNSLNHYCFGAIAEFLYRIVAGINELEPGFKSMIVAPKLDRRLTYVNATYDSASGKIVSNWRIEKDGTLHWHVEIPFDTSAVLVFPDNSKTITVTCGSYDYNVALE